jgi:hypothetical protein
VNNINIIRKQIKDTFGEREDRVSGRTTAILLGIISEAMKYPGCHVDIYDHVDSVEVVKRHSIPRLAELIERLGLNSLVINFTERTLTYDLVPYEEL